MRKIKIGVLGVGYLGKIHLRCLRELSEVFEIVGFVDPAHQAAQQVVEQFGIYRFKDLETLLQHVDAVDVVTPTTTHFELAAKSIAAQKHTFIEKPVTQTLAEAETLLSLARKYEVKVQVGHIERFNPTFLSLQQRIVQPKFIEAHRLSMFNPRGTDVSVVLDLMIHDLDLLLQLVSSEIVQVDASGASVLTDALDIANARVAFANGCVANLTASRISMQPTRRFRIFQPNAYISLDLLEKKAQIIQLNPASTMQPELNFQVKAHNDWFVLEEPPIQPNNAIQSELASFAESIKQNQAVKVDLEAGYKVMALAHRIIDNIQERGTYKN